MNSSKVTNKKLIIKKMKKGKTERNKSSDLNILLKKCPSITLEVKVHNITRTKKSMDA